jgi:uncharacterized coiled-coil DUF342 family protein
MEHHSKPEIGVDEEAPSFDSPHSSASMDRNPKRGKLSQKRPNTIDTSPTITTVDSYDLRSPSTAALTIEHSVKTEKSSDRILQKMKKPILIILGLILSGSSAFFFQRWLTIPGLNHQIERLEAQNARLAILNDELESQVDRLADETDRLGIEVDRLSNENDRYAHVNDQLAANITELKFQNDVLNVSLQLFLGQNGQLNESVTKLAIANVELRAQVNIYVTLNDILNTTALRLEQEVDRLARTNEDLVDTNTNLWQAIDVLSNETSALSGRNEYLNQTVQNLNAEVVILSTEIDRLHILTSNLGSVVRFLNETAASIDQNFDEFAAYLASQTDYYRFLVVNTLELLHLQQISNWDCDFRSFFATESFANNRSQPIGVSRYAEVMAYVDNHILTGLCLSKLDFEEYLDSEVVKSGVFPPANVSVNELTRAVNMYSTLALQFYFPPSMPNGGDGFGLTPMEWSDASYQCEKLGSTRQYKFFVKQQ